MAVTTIAVVSTRCEVLMSSPIQQAIQARSGQLRKVREDERGRALRRATWALRGGTDRVEGELDRTVRRSDVVLERAAEVERGAVGSAALPEGAADVAAAGVLDGDGHELLAGPGRDIPSATAEGGAVAGLAGRTGRDRKSTRLNSSHANIS